jgi:tetratricopeptide (TPR) repeat protein
VKRFAVLLLGCLVSTCIALPGIANEEALAQLEAAVAQHPDDPDLAWLEARALAEANRRAAALARLEALLARWPERRAGAWLLQGQLLAEDERHAEALAPLRRALDLDPDLGAAHLQLGLSLRALGNDEEADAQLAAASLAEPGLRGETLLLRALSRLERGDESSAHAMLTEAIELDPASDAAASARLLLGERPGAPLGKRLRVDAYAGMEFDSNVTLDNGDIVGLSRNRNDVAGVWGTSISGDVYQGERVSLTLGTRYDARRYVDLHSYDTDDLLAFFSARVHGNERLSWRLDGFFSQGFLDDEPYLRRTQVRPNLLLLLGERAGVLRLHADAEALWYEDQPPAIFSSLERDGYSVGAGFEHYVAIPGVEEGFAALRFGYSHNVTEGDGLLVFEGDYDHDRVGGGVRARLVLPLALTLEGDVGAFGELYHHDNLVDFLNRPIGSSPRKRCDVAVEAGLRLVRPVTRYLDLELSWRFLDRDSNTDVYRYDRHVASLRLRVHGL